MNEEYANAEDKGKWLANHPKAHHYKSTALAQRIADKVGRDQGIVMQPYYCCRQGFRLKNLGYAAGHKPAREDFEHGGPDGAVPDQGQTD